jgi:hypothetical protein
VAAGLVTSPELWKHSDYNEWIGNRAFLFDGKDLRSLFFDTAKEYYRNMLNRQNTEIPFSLKGHTFD